MTVKLNEYVVVTHDATSAQPGAVGTVQSRPLGPNLLIPESQRVARARDALLKVTRFNRAQGQTEAFTVLESEVRAISPPPFSGGEVVRLYLSAQRAHWSPGVVQDVWFSLSADSWFIQVHHQKNAKGHPCIEEWRPAFLERVGNWSVPFKLGDLVRVDPTRVPKTDRWDDAIVVGYTFADNGQPSVEVMHGRAESDVTMRAGWPCESLKLLARSEPLACVAPVPLSERTCAACRKQLASDEMEQVHQTSGFGTCKPCYKLMWDAANEKLAERRARPTMDVDVFVRFYVGVLSVMSSGEEAWFQYRRSPPPFAEERGLGFKIVDTDDVQFLLPGAVPYGDPCSMRDAAEKVFAFLTGKDIAESFARDA